ncbi:hypothetical protein FHL15_000153 [Xylaria flabelliformis]|uniref:Uncharacterized protein n=1 Tax=Xylaria flabelliformis TaxID=2512241 RepID=A0A553IF23_9PEZI|nr:hypothetical protein FHL15_000153 [Xylaria flabelliformis]
MPDDYKRLPALDSINISSESCNEKFATRLSIAFSLKQLTAGMKSSQKHTMILLDGYFKISGARRMASLYDQGESNEMYLITGKPDSGKSTLIKFLVSDKRLSFNLRRWSNGFNPLLATYFSWNADKDPELLVPIVFLSRRALAQILFSQAGKKLAKDRTALKLA